MTRVRKQPHGPVAPQPVAPTLSVSARIYRFCRPHAPRLLAVWALALAAYSNSFGTGLVFDNTTIILRDTRVRAMTAENLHRIVSEEYWSNTLTNGLYRPLTTFTYLVNYAGLGNADRPAGYHVVNFALHAANIALVYFLALAVLGEGTAGLWLAAIWGVHPLLTEAVTNVVGRADLLAAFGVLAGLLCHIHGASSVGRRALAWRCGLALAAGIGMFSKENAAVLPAIMLLWDLFDTRRETWRQRLPNYIAVALPLAVYLYLRADMLAHTRIGVTPFADNPLVGTDFWAAKLTAIRVIGSYLWLFFWPLRLSADYSYNTIPLFGWRLTSLEDVKTLVSLAVCLGLAAAALAAYRGRKPLALFLGFFFLAIAPVSNLPVIIGTIMAERLMYLPSVGIAGCLVLGLVTVRRRFRLPLAWAIVAVICAAFAARTFTRNFDWRDERSLWTSAAQVVPASYRAHSQLATTLLATNPPAVDAAMAEVDRSLRILEGLPPELNVARTYQVAGLCYRLKGDSLAAAAAAPWYNKALTILLQAEKIDAAAMAELRRANREHGKPVVAQGWPPVYLELGQVYLRLAQPDQALETLQYGRLRSFDPAFSEEISRAWLAKNDWERAAIALVEGVVINLDSAQLAAELASLYRERAPMSCALTRQNSLNLECPLVHGHVCSAVQNMVLAYRTNGRPDVARAVARAGAQTFGCPAL